jgi:hypothetical protein
VGIRPPAETRHHEGLHALRRELGGAKSRGRDGRAKPGTSRARGPRCLNGSRRTCRWFPGSAHDSELLARGYFRSGSILHPVSVSGGTRSICGRTLRGYPDLGGRRRPSFHREYITSLGPGTRTVNPKKVQVPRSIRSTGENRRLAAASYP